MSTRKSLLVVKGARVFSSDFCNSRGGCYVFVSKEGKREISRSCGVTNLKQTSALREWWYQRCLLVCLQRQLWNKEGDRWSRADETRERQQTKVGGRPILTILTSTILNHQLLTTFSFKGFDVSKWLLLLFWYNIPLMLDLSHFNWESAKPFFSIPGYSCFMLARISSTRMPLATREITSPPLVTMCTDPDHQVRWQSVWLTIKRSSVNIQDLQVSYTIYIHNIWRRFCQKENMFDMKISFVL